MTDTAASATGATGATEAPKGLLARVIGVVVSPRATFADVAARPRSAGVLGIVMLVIMAGTFALLSTEVGQQAWLDGQVKAAESFGRPMADAQYQTMERIAPYVSYIAACAQLIFIPLGVLIIAGITLGVFNALLGGDATFKQVVAVVAHAGIINTLAAVFAFPLDYARETLSSPTNLGVFVPFLDEASFLARLLGSIDLFLIWALVTLSIGLGVLYKRRTGPIATGMLMVYAVIVLAVAAIRSALS
jgi:hypothetical protein